MRYAIVLLVLLAACGKNPVSPPVVPHLSIVAGNEQSDTVGATLPVQLGAVLTDATTGAPLPGRVINWMIVSGGGATFVAVSQTGQDGVARNQWTLGPITGEQKLVARWLDPDTGAPITLDTAFATAGAGMATQLRVAFVGSNQLAVGDTAAIAYDYIDSHNNGGAPCADGKDGDRVVWRSTDSSSVLPLGTVIVLSNGRHATQIVAQKAKTGATDIYGDGSACAPATVLAGVSYLTH
jgi:hypothetical protein